MENKELFNILCNIDVNEYIETKKSGNVELTYLSWANCWKIFKKECPDAKYEIRHWGDKPYLFDEKTGYMVETSITAGGETHVMWLPVMDSINHAMMDKPYQIQTKFKTIDIPAATMFDINKTIMRCLVKNMAMFGLGLYIYAGEDLPADSDEPEQKASVEDIIKSIEESMTVDNCKKFYARAIELYPKGTDSYKQWVKVWADKKDQLEKGAVQQDLKQEFDALEKFYE